MINGEWNMTFGDLTQIIIAIITLMGIIIAFISFKRSIAKLTDKQQIELLVTKQDAKILELENRLKDCKHERENLTNLKIQALESTVNMEKQKNESEKGEVMMKFEELENNLDLRFNSVGESIKDIKKQIDRLFELIRGDKR